MSTNIACLKRQTSVTERELKPTNYLLNRWFTSRLLHERMNGSRSWTTSTGPPPPPLINRCLLSLFGLRNSKSLVRRKRLGMCHSDPLRGKKKKSWLSILLTLSNHTEPPDSCRRGGADEIGLTGLVIVMYPVMGRERERGGWWVYPHRASDLACFDVTAAPRA